MRPRHVWLAVALLAVGAGGLAAVLAPSYGRAVSLVVRSAGLGKQYPRLAAWYRSPLVESPLTIPSRHGPLNARIYRPVDGSAGSVLLVPGVNALGVNEPRLVAFARALAETRLLVVAAEMPDLSRYLVTPRTADMIEDAARWLANRRDLSPDGRVGMMGISFAGGLSVVAAGRPPLADRVAFVFAFGGHASFPNVLRFLCTGVEPLPARMAGRALRPGTRLVEGGIWHKPHDYGVAVLALALADRLVPRVQVEPLSLAIRTFLHASHLALYDRQAADRTFEEARGLAAALPEPASTIMREVNTRDVQALGGRLLPLIDEIGRPPALSPVRSPVPAAPVYLLHGIDDDVIPAQETLLLEEYLEGRTAVHVLLSGLISHAELDRPPTAADIWQLVSFWASLLRQ